MTSKQRFFIILISFCVVLPVSLQADPVIDIEPENINADLFSGDVSERDLIIFNLGDEDLVIAIEHVITAEPERDQNIHSGRNDQTGPRRDDLGDEISRFDVGARGWSGLAWDGELMWGIGGDQEMIAFDPEAEEVVETVNLDGLYIGMAYDGEFFWAGFWPDDNDRALIQRIDREGNVNRTLNVRGIWIHGVACDGENLWYNSVDFQREGTFFIQITTDGEQIREIDCSDIIEQDIYSLAWVPGHEDGNLWAISFNNNRTIYQLDISGDEPEIVQEARIDGPGASGLEHDGENMWYCSQDDVWRVIDDGIVERNWLSYDPDQGVLEPDEHIDVTVTLDATDLNEGVYEAEIHIINNDPDNDDAIVNVVMDVIGIPAIEVTWDEEIGYPEVINWNEAYIDLFTNEAYPIPVTIKNIGTAALEVEDIFCEEEELFSPDVVEFVLDPDDEIEVNFILETDESGVYEAEMIIVWNSPDEEDYIIPLTGETSAPPVIELEPDEIQTDLNTGDIERADIRVSNDGGSALRFSIDYTVIEEPERDQNMRTAQWLNGNEAAGPRRDDLGDVIDEFDFGDVFWLWSGLAWDGELMWGMSYNERQLIGFDPEAEEIVEEVNINGTYNGLTYDGEAFWAGFWREENDQIHRLDRNGNVIRTVDIQDVMIRGVAFDGENLWYSYVNMPDRIVIFKQINLQGELLREVNCENILMGEHFSVAWVPEHDDGNLWVLGWGNRTLYQLDVSGDEPEIVQQTQLAQGEWYPLEHDGVNMWYTIVEGDWLVIDDGIAELHWLSCDPESGEIDPDSNTDVILTINAVGLLEGDYVADIHFISNDPETSDAAVRLLMHITAAPVIEVTWDDDAGYPDRIDWNQAYLDVFTGVPYPIPVTIKNIGTTALEVDDILSEEQVFSSDQNEFVLDPDDEMVVNFILETEEEGIFESEMVIVWNSPNDEDAVIHLIGRTSLPPVIEVDPTDIEAHLEVGDSDDQIVNITNAGSSTLRFEIEHVIISEPERDRSEQPGPQRDDFGDIINEFNVGVGYWSGLACDGELMWGININQGRMISFDPEAEEVVEEVNLRGEYYGMTYDGEFFWIGTVGGDDMNARILRIDRNGDVSQTINVPGWQATGVAFDGENLWYYSNDWEQEAVIIRQITTEGDQIREINCSNILQGGMISLAWVPEHEDGNLWAIGWEARTIYQLNISEDDPEALQETRIIGANVFGLEHDGENMWYCTVDDVWYVIDDGLNESNWLSYDPKEGELDAHAEIDIFVTLDATEALEGDYEADMHIFSNDPDNSDLIINIIMSVGQSSAPLESAVPDDYHLSAAYPNPFNAMTTIRYALPHSASISLQVYDINGRLTTTLFTGERSAGHYSTIWNAQSNPTGMYFIRMDTPDFNAVRKVVLTK